MTAENTEYSVQFSLVAIQLFKGILCRDQHPQLWHDLLQQQSQLIDYVKVLGLELYMDEGQGFAYFKRLPQNEKEESVLPPLVQRRPLSYPVSLLCVLLRKKLIEADAQGADLRVVLTRQQIVETLRVFLPEQSNEARIVDQIDTHINKVVELGFLRKLKGSPPSFEIRRIIKALVDADWLADLEEKLEIYHNHAINIDGVYT